MNFYSIWPYFPAMALLLWLAGTSLFKRVAPPIPASNRLEGLDGLRGFAALGVFFQHAAIYHYWLQTGSWYFSGSRFYLNLGQLGVAMFFMLTGFLFWGQVLDHRGKPKWAKLYVGRLFRIVPLAFVAGGLVLVGAAISSNFVLRELPAQVFLEALRWLSAGAFDGVDVNGVKDTWLLIFGVTWTLHFEWLFYLSLPALALFSRSPRVAAALLFTFLVAVLIHSAPMPNRGQASIEVVLALFAAGMLTAAVTRIVPRRPSSISDRVGSFALLGLLVCALMLFKSENQSAPLVLMALAFFLIIRGFSLFGLLTSTGAKRLGDVSFGIYLLQGLVVNSVFHIPGARQVDQASPAGHWAIMTGSAVIIVFVATAAHLLIERPGIALGRRVFQRVQSFDRHRNMRVLSISE